MIPVSESELRFSELTSPAAVHETPDHSAVLPAHGAVTAVALAWHCHMVCKLTEAMLVAATRLHRPLSFARISPMDTIVGTEVGSLVG